MTPLLPFTLASVSAAAAVPWLLPAHEPLAWSALAGIYLGTVAHASWRIDAPLLGPTLCRLPGEAPRVALTFDDGPDPAVTPRLLDVLREHRATATFFCVGSRVRAHPELARRCRDEGHQLGNHSDRHSLRTPFLFGRALAADLTSCQNAIAAVAGTAPSWFRPPFGVRNHATASVCARLGLRVAGWSVRGLDMPGKSAAAISDRVLARARAGDIVLLHDGGRDPARQCACLTAILQGLAARGLVTAALPD